MIRLKTREEIDSIAASGEVLSSVMLKFKSFIRPGITLEEIDRYAAELTKEAKCLPSFYQYDDFPGRVCLSVNEVVIHGVPSSQKLKEGDIIGCDFGINKNGYFSDSAYTFAVGKIAPEVKRFLDITRASLYAGIAAIHVGGRVSDISEAVFGVLRSGEYGVIEDYTGHGVGLYVHEGPSIPNYPFRGVNPRLKNGMVLAIEPMSSMGRPEVDVNEEDGWTVSTVDGSLAAHFEHTIALWGDKTEILTGGPLWDNC